MISKPRGDIFLDHMSSLLLFTLEIVAIALCLLFVLMEGYGHMTQQLQHQEMRPYTVGQRSCRLNGIVNQTAWYVIQHHTNVE